MPQLGPPEHWPACLRRAALLPARLSEGLDTAPVDTFFHCVHCMHLAVLAQRMATCSAERDGSGCALFLRAPQPGERERYPWADLESPVALAIGASAPHVAGHAAWVAGVGAGLSPQLGPLGESADVAAGPRRGILGRAGPGL